MSTAPSQAQPNLEKSRCGSRHRPASPAAPPRFNARTSWCPAPVHPNVQRYRSLPDLPVAANHPCRPFQLRTQAPAPCISKEDQKKERYRTDRNCRKEGEMTTRIKMLLSVGTILAVLAVAGCATSTPPMPLFEAEESLAAANTCQVVFSCSNRACVDLRPAYNRPRPVSHRCLTACGACLEACYAGCE